MPSVAELLLGSKLHLPSKYFCTHTQRRRVSHLLVDFILRIALCKHKNAPKRHAQVCVLTVKMQQVANLSRAWVAARIFRVRGSSVLFEPESTITTRKRKLI